jgi:hypothetical protein
MSSVDDNRSHLSMEWRGFKFRERHMKSKYMPDL